MKYMSKIINKEWDYGKNRIDDFQFKSLSCGQSVTSTQLMGSMTIDINIT